MKILIYYSKGTGSVDRIYWDESIFQDVIDSNPKFDETHFHFITDFEGNPPDVYSKYLLKVDLATKEVHKIAMPPQTTGA